MKILLNSNNLKSFFLLGFLCCLSSALNAQSLKFTSHPEKDGMVGEAYEYHITTDGSSYWSREIYLSSGTLPQGLTLVDHGDGTADMTGIIQEAGKFDLELTVRQFFNSKEQKFKLSIDKGNAQLSLMGLNTTYNGNPQNINYSTDPPDLEEVIITYNGSQQLPTNAGSYNVEAHLNNDNYKGNTSATFTINKADATITVTGLDAIYDGTSKPVSVTTVPENLDVQVTYNGSGNAPKDKGSYAVNVAIDDANYKGTFSGTLTIGKGNAEISIDNLTATYNGQQHPVSVSTNPPGLDYSVTYNGSVDAPKNAGSYDVDVKVNDPNYKGEEKATLNISKAIASLSIGNVNTVYNGSAKQVTVTTNPANLPFTVTYNGSTQKPVNAGNYDVSVTINDSNYKGTETATLNISKASSSIVVSDLNRVYDGNPKIVNAVTTPSGLSLNITYNGSVENPISVGSYDVKAVVDEVNYKGSTQATLIITKGQAEVSLSNLMVTYNGEPQGANVFTVPSGLDTRVTYNGNEAEPREIGNYQVNAEITDPNYDGFASGTFVIKEPEGVNARPVLTNIESSPILYSQGDPSKPVSETIIINDFDNGYMKSARISISENMEEGKDILEYNNTSTPKIKGSYNKQTGILELIGEDSRSNYETAIKNVAYRTNTFGEIGFTNKKIQIVVNDGFNDSDPAFRNVNISILPEIELVTAFTPNGDNVNDTWNFVNLDQYSSVKISIFNTDGKEIYNCMGFDCEWNGTYQGVDLPPGPYFYTISLNNDKRKYRGTVTILK